jgi:LysR family transcriptional regulator, glycine cleavage system transcriptional activator
MPNRPPLNALYVFCEVARCSSFKLAAQNLCVTPGAVSRQIKALEAYLGHTLFERNPQSIFVTRKGQLLFDRVANKMAFIESEVGLIRTGGRKTVIRVDTGVTLSMHWLIPRLAQFSEQYPHIQVQISTADGPVLMNKQADVYIRREVAELRGLLSTKFVEEYAVLVGSKKLLIEKSRLSPSEVIRLPRIAARSRPDLWPIWCTNYRLDAAKYRATQEFDNTILAIQAASQGLGVMVVPMMFIEEVLASGLLSRLSADKVRTGSYSFATRVSRNSQHITSFIEWLMKVSK